jgi:hypothetical protein
VPEHWGIARLNGVGTPIAHILLTTGPIPYA